MFFLGIPFEPPLAGIIAKISGGCSEYGANILDISQTVLDEYFTMIMIVDIAELSIDFNLFIDRMESIGKANNLQIHVMHEDIFNAMHKI